MRQPHETMAESSLASDDDHEFISGSDMDSAEHYGSDGGPMESHGDAGMTTASEDDDTASEDDVADPRFAMDDSFEDSFANDARSNGDDANDADGVPANTSSSSSPTTTTTTTSPHRPLDAAALQSFRADNDATGVVYMSRVPPKMKPQKVRHLLQQFGEVRRIYLAAEDLKSRERRIRNGGNRKRNFNEGWIEFGDKRIAKLVARTLNSTPMGGKKSNYYHDDLWNLKYLPKFKWTHLAQQLAYERQERSKKLQVEVRQAKAEMDLYRRNVDKAKMIAAMDSKRAAKNANAAALTSGSEATAHASAATTSMDKSKTEAGPATSDLDAIRRRFRQRKAIIDGDAEDGAARKASNASTNGRPSTKTKSDSGASVKRVLSKIFT